MRGSELVVKALRENGVSCMFGIPGDAKARNGKVTEALLFESLGKRADELRFVTTVHEQNAAFMADGWGRVTGEPGTVYTTLGPGASNLVTAIANAYQDHAPLVALSAQLPETQHDPDYHQYVDYAKMFGPITKAHYRVGRAADATRISDAYAVARAERPGPTHIELLADVFEEESAPVSVAPRPARALPHTRVDDEVVAEIRRAKKPIVFAANAVMRAGATAELVRLAERLHVPVVTSFQGKGAFPTDHPLHLGVASRHVPASRAALESADLILGIGYDFTEGVVPGFWGASKPVIHVDTDVPTGSAFYKPTHLVLGDLKHSLHDLASREMPAKWTKEEIAALKPARATAQGDALEARGVVADLRATLRDDDVVFVDVGYHKQLMGLHYDARAPRTVHFSNGYSTMGPALPSAIGAKAAKPGARIVAVAGDNSFAMGAMELRTAVNYDLPVTAIVLNDSGLGMIRREQRNAYGGNYATEQRAPDFVKLAESFGARGHRVHGRRELRSALEEALAAPRATVIEVPIHYD